MKKIMTMLCALLCISTLAYIEKEIANGITWEYSVSDGEAEIIHASVSGRVPVPGRASLWGNIVIPDTLGGYPVTSIEGLRFADIVSASITIPGSVTNIGSEFSHSTGLTSVTLLDGVTSIGDRAFAGCSGLTEITLPGSVTNIGESAFARCKGLRAITIPGSVKSIGEGAFWSCRGLTSIAIPGSVKSIGVRAFGNCRDMTSITLSGGVTSIGRSAFVYCTGLTEITIPDSVTSIGGGAFLLCRGLTKIRIPDGAVLNMANLTDGNDAAIEYY